MEKSHKMFDEERNSKNVGRKQTQREMKPRTFKDTMETSVKEGA